MTDNETTPATDLPRALGGPGVPYYDPTITHHLRTWTRDRGTDVWGGCTCGLRYGARPAAVAADCYARIQEDHVARDVGDPVLF